MEKLSIGGIKVSNEVVQINLLLPDTDRSPLSTICRVLSRHTVNVPFLTWRRSRERGFAVSLCVSTEDGPAAIAALSSLDVFRDCLSVIDSAAIITVFPRREGFELLGIVLKAWADAGIPLHGLATSLSAVSCTTDFACVEKAVAALADALDLPCDHAPFSSPLKVTQSPLVKGT